LTETATGFRPKSLTLLLQAEQKAADASAQAQEYYHKLTNSWTPHWLEQKWAQGSNWFSKTALSDKSGKQNAVGRYVSLAKVKLAAFWEAAKVGAIALCNNLIFTGNCREKMLR